MKRDLIDRVRHRVVQTAVGPSALRNQGNRNVVQKARRFLDRIDLNTFEVGVESRFRARLDESTAELQAYLPSGARNWGTARKALNLFLRDVAYAYYLRERYGFERLEPWLEVPLDSLTAAGISRSRQGRAVPRWPGVKHLDVEVSDIYQAAAARIAQAEGIHRVHLDLTWWRA